MAPGRGAALLMLLPSALAAQLQPSRHPAPLPAIPAANGPLALQVVYPERGQLVAAQDSSFVFGSVGTGRAGVAINGQQVSVAPNGGWLAWIALPAPADSGAAVLHVVARTPEGDSAALDWPIRLPVRSAPPNAPAAWIDTTSLAPRGRAWLPAGEMVRVSVRAASGAVAWLALPDGRTVPLAPDTAAAHEPSPFARGTLPGTREQGVTRYTGWFPAAPLGGALPPVLSDSGVPPADSARRATLVVASGADTARAALPFRLALLDTAHAPVVVVGGAAGRAGSGQAVGMPGPGGPYEWLLADGTPAQVTGRTGGYVRLKLSNASVTWISRDEVLGQLPAGTPAPAARVGLVRLAADSGSVTARIVLGGRVPFRVDEDDDRLTLTLYSAVSGLDWVQYGSTDSTVRRVRWAQPASDVVTVTFELSRPLFGYRYRWDGTDLLLEIRKPPAVDRRHPLRGLVIAVDPGHPPLGATGPTRLREADANLAVGLALRSILEREGARVVMTRTTDTASGLYDRTNLAEAVNADLLVSIHNNAFPDGVNPFENNGSSTYYFHPRAARLAFLIQRGLLSEMGLRDLGYGRGDLALARPAWMPAVLAEGAFLMIPEQEQALRTPAFQQAYARGVAIGIEQYLAERFGVR